MSADERSGQTTHGAAPASRLLLLKRAVQLHRQGNLALAERAYLELLAAAPNDADALHLLGVIEGQKGNPEAALELIGRSLRVNPGQALAHSNRAKILLRLKRADLALESARQALRLDPRLTEAFSHEGAALQLLGQQAEALRSYDRALALGPGDSSALTRRGYLLLELRQPQAALASFDAALRLSPQNAENYRGRGRALYELNRFDAALVSLEEGLRLDPGDASAHNARGIVLHALGLAPETIVSYDRALQLGGPDASTYANRAAALGEAGRAEEALADWQRALTLTPDYPYGLGNLLYARLQCCDWRDYEATTLALISGVRAQQRVATPFAFLSASDSPQTQLACAKIYFADRYQRPPAAPPVTPSRGQRRLQVGYLSADFRKHATAHLMAGLLESHDRAAFAITGFSSGRDDQSPMRERLRSAFERFIDLRELSDGDASDLIRRLGIDILVDLNGFAAGGRIGIAARRPAPIQVSYLGYPGTLGSDCIDYLIADRHVVPTEDRGGYSEKIVYLPNCYQPNDRQRAIGAVSSREAEGLPERGFVFCCFNVTYKITPVMFALWMRLLQRVEGSVLWLFASGAAAQLNLRREAVLRGIAAERLVFAEPRDPSEHLARCALADLFLDTLPVNAHTTASDALWAGLPVLTRTGGSFAGRVAGSLLRAVGLAEMITDSLQHYEERAFQLATRPEELARIRATLAQNRLTHPLFDTDAYRRQLEAAYRLMWERWQSGQAPASFEVAAD